jgi:hypothetical protein
MIKILSENSYSEENYSVNTCIIELKSACLVLITDQDNFGIGNVILSSPPTVEGMGAISAPAPLFGLDIKRDTLSKMTSELLAKSLKKPCLLLFSIKGYEKKELITSKCVIESVKLCIENIKNE